MTNRQIGFDNKIPMVQEKLGRNFSENLTERNF